MNDAARKSQEAKESYVTPEKIARYLVQDEIGRGGIGVVYRAHDPLIGRLVALKTVPIADPEHRARFR